MCLFAPRSSVSSLTQSSLSKRDLNPLGEEADITDPGVLRHRAIAEWERWFAYKRWRPSFPTRCTLCESSTESWVAFDDGYREGEPWRVAMCDYHLDWWNSLRAEAKQGAPSSYQAV